MNKMSFETIPPDDKPTDEIGDTFKPADEIDDTFKPAELPVTAIPMVLGSPLSKSPSLLSLGSSPSSDADLDDEEIIISTNDELEEEEEFLEDLHVRVSEESIPEMVHVYRRKLSYVNNTDLRSHLKDDFDRILLVKNKRLWRLSNHMTQNLQTITDYYRSQLDVKEYQLFLYRTKLKVMIKHMFDMAEKQDNKLARDHFNNYLNELLQAPPDASNPPMKIPSMFDNLPEKTPALSAQTEPSGFFKRLKQIFFCS
uniref:Uncharacterized protein n=1 Tax=Strigamia maritima TaxID=126957 RepID=T1J902_STRMM